MNEEAWQAGEQQLWKHLEEEHRRLDRVLDDVQALAGRGSFLAASKRFGECRRGQEQHIQAEGALLGQLERAPQCPGFVRHLRSDHEQVLALLDEITALLSQWEMAHFTKKLSELGSLLRRHESDERRYLFPVDEAAREDPLQVERR